MYQRQIFKTALTNRVLHDPRQKRLFSQKDLHDLLTLQPDRGKGRQAGEVETASSVANASRKEDVNNNSAGSNGNSESLKELLKSKGLVSGFDSGIVFFGCLKGCSITQIINSPSIQQGVFDHSFVDPSSNAAKSASARELEEEANRMAREAAEALRSSVDSNEFEADPFTPTWTGAPESRFVGAGNAGPQSKGTGSLFGGAATAGVVGSNGTSKSSGSLLASLRQRNQAIQSDGKRRSSLTGNNTGDT